MALAERELDAMLARLAAEARYPETPVLSVGVGPLMVTPGPRPRLLRAIIAMAAALVIVAAFAGVLATERAREAVADFLGFGVPGERIELLRDQPVEGASLWPQADAAVTEVSTGQVEAVLGAAPRLPPDAEVVRYYALEFRGFRGIVVRTEHYDIWQFRNDIGILLSKTGFEGSTSIEQVTVEGRSAYFAVGGPRVLTLLDAQGNRVARVGAVDDTNALVFADGPITFRIEGSLTLEEALEIAQQLLD